MKWSPSKKIQLASVLSGSLLCMLTQYLVSPALPAIMNHYGLTADVVQWLTTGFTMTCALMIPMTAFLIQRFSVRRLFLMAMGAFFAGSLLLGSNLAFPLVLSGRILQALGAGVMAPLAQVFLLQSFPKERRGTAMGMMGLVIAAAPALGPVLAGLTVDRFGWYWIFRGVALCAAIVLLAAWFVLQKESRQKGLTLDVTSLLLSCLGFGGLLYGFSTIPDTGVLSLPVLLSLAMGGVGLYLLVRRQDALDSPFLDFRVIRVPTFRRAILLTMVANASVAGGTVLVPIFAQNVCQHSATASGIIMAPGAIMLGLLSPFVGKIFDKKGPRSLNMVGFTFLTLGNLGFCFLAPTWSVVIITTLYTVRMMGVAMNNAPLMTWAMSDLSDAMTPHGVSLFNTLRQIAGALGTALMVMVLRLTEQAGGNTLAATTYGLSLAFAVAGGLSLLALLVTLNPLPKPNQTI